MNRKTRASYTPEFKVECAQLVLARVFETISMKDAIELISNGSKKSVFIPFMTIKPAIARPLSGLPYTPLDKNILSKDSIIEFKGTLNDY